MLSRNEDNALKVLLVGNETQRAEVREALAQLGDPPLNIIEAEPELADANGNGNGNGNGSSNGNGNGSDADRPNVVMVIFDDDEDAPVGYLQAQADHAGHPPLFALLHERSAALMRRVLRAGAEELLFLPLDAGDVTRALLKISESQRKVERHAGGSVISIVSTVGGVGVTSLSANLALALRYSLDKRVAAVDLDLQTGGLGVFLNLEPDRTIMALADPDKRLDSIALESALCKHASGIYLLPAPKRIEDSELIGDTTVGGVLDLMRQMFDYVVVDCGSHISEVSVAAWERSDHLFYMLDQSIAAARCAWRFVELFGRLGLKGVEPAFILSRFTPGHPISEQQITHTLGQPIYAKVPRDEKALERVQMRAQDLWQVAPGSPLAHSAEELAHQIAAGAELVPGEGAGANGIVSRLLNAFSPRN